MSRRSENQLIRLASREFNALLAADPELRRLKDLQYDRPTEAQQLLEILSITPRKIGSLPIRTLSAAKWAFLWLLESPYVNGGTVHELDLDLMLYVLALPDLRKITASPWELPILAGGYRQATGLSLEATHAEVQKIRNLAFHPLELLPPTALSSEPERFDTQWLMRIGSIAARESGEPMEKVIHEMSLAAVCSLYVNWRARESTDGQQIRHRPNEALTRQISARVECLADEFLSQSGQ